MKRFLFTLISLAKKLPQASSNHTDWQYFDASLTASRPLSGLSHPFGLFSRFRNTTDIREGGFRQVIPLAVTQFFKAFDRFIARSDLPLLTGERFGDEERLRQEALDASSAMHDEFVFFALFIDTENCDDVLKFAVSLQNLLHATSNLVVTFAHDQGVENSR